MIYKCFARTQIVDRAAHRLHAEHQNRKAEHDLAHMLLRRSRAEHAQNKADNGNDRRKRIGGQKLKPARGSAANIGKADYPAGDARSDYRAHDDAYRLTNLHHAGVNKADDHNGCGRGRLYNGRNSRAEQYAL